MRNIWTITGKELNAYFRSPIAYIVLAVFAVIFGFFFYSMLSLFMRQVFEQAQYSAMYGRLYPLNVNEMLIRPLLMNVSVVCLFLVPMITMRLFAEEKKTGTIELLMTSPVTDLQIILGKFLASFLLYAALLGITLLYVLLLFLYGDPDWRPLVAGYLGQLLLGGCFLSFGLLLSTFTRNQLVAGSLTFGLFLLLWVIDWVSDYSSSGIGQIANYLSFTTHIENFSKGVLDLKDIVYYISVIGLGLFLTTRSVESVRWRG
ncbi:MAG: ABC transporter permease subunit [Acidobacteria bacterium]|nr:ABC transporter permease subunit [Acidobacteriota bacterium]